MDVQVLLESGFLDRVVDEIDSSLGGIVDRDDGDDASDRTRAVKHVGYGQPF